MRDRLERDSSIPPQDALAEAVVLRALLLQPSSIVEYDPTLLLVYPEHRVVLTCMKSVYRLRGSSWGQFYAEWVYACEHLKPGLSRVLDGVPEDTSRLHNAVPHPEQDFLYWWARLKQVAEARRLVSVAQSMADLAWKGDVEGAQAVARVALPRATAEVSVWEREAL